MNLLPTTEQLKLFLIYSEIGDLYETALKANISPSELQTTLQNLETSLNTQLITPRSNHSHLTKEGEDFAKQVKEIITCLEKITYDFRRQGKQAITLNVGALLTMGDILLDQDILYFETLYPHIKLHIINQEAKDICKLLENDLLDLAILFNLEQLHFNKAKYDQTPLFSEKLVYYAPTINRSGNTISLEEVVNIPLVEYAPHYVMNYTIQQYIKEYNLGYETAAWFTNPYQLINHCQQYSVGSIQCERLLHQFGLYNGYYNIQEPTNINYHLFTRRDKEKNEAIQSLAQFLKAKYKAL